VDRKMTLGSLFDGSGGFPLGALLTGIEPLWASEVEPFPILVTTKRIPKMKHYGDIRQINGSKIEPVDIISFGSPCTDMSVAGKRAGLDGKQSVLFYEAIRIITEMRCATNGRYPRFILWENVPGAFSSNKGADFKAVLEAIIRIAEPEAEVPAPKNGRWSYADILLGNGWSVAYRTIDAQFFGVAQRRKRIYLVADFGSENAGEILFEPEGVSRDFAPCSSPGQRTAGDAQKCTGASGNSVTCLNDQGGSILSVTENVTGTLRAQEHGHQPCVMQSSGFCTEHSSKSRGVGYEKEKSPTLRAGVVPGAVMSFEPGAVSRIGGHTVENLSGSLRAKMGDNQTAVAIENHPTDGRCKIEADGKVQTLTSRMGTGGMNVPLVIGERPKRLKIRSGCEGGQKGALVQEDISATLGYNNDQTVIVPTAYGICSNDSNSMKSDNPHSGIYEATTSRTIDANGGNPGCNQGGIAVVALQGSMIGRDDKNGPQGSGVNEDISFSLTAADRHAVAYAMTTGSFAEVHAERAATLLARDYKDVQIVNRPQYTVRRLTPTECARLQGFPDWWCSDLETAEPTEEDIVFWAEVWEIHRLIMGVSSKPKSRNQIIKWLQNPYSDSAEYKMWGAGVALPCVIFVLGGIVELIEGGGQHGNK
jgi:DNA (cytosine-5)-methyltransferase 1